MESKLDSKFMEDRKNRKQDKSDISNNNRSLPAINLKGPISYTEGNRERQKKSQGNN